MPYYFPHNHFLRVLACTFRYGKLKRPALPPFTEQCSSGLKTVDPVLTISGKKPVLPSGGRQRVLINT